MNYKQNNTTTVPAQGLDALIAIGKGEWPQLEPIGEAIQESMPYPVEALGDTISGAVKAVAQGAGIQPALVANNFLVAAALAVQPLANVTRKNMCVPLSIYAVTIAESGERKTYAEKWALKQHWQRQTIAFAEYEAEKAVFKANSQDNPELAPPRNPAFLVQDFTAEGLAKKLEKGFPAVGIFESEGGTFVGGWGMQKDNQLRTSAAISKFWDGAPQLITRKSSEDDIYLEGKRLCMHLGMQPGVARALYSNESTKDQGLLSRLLPVSPPPRQPMRQEDMANLDEDGRLQEYWAQADRLMKRWPSPQLATLNLREIPLAEEAERLWSDFSYEMDCRRSELATVKDFVSKLAEHALRISAVLTLFSNPDASQVDSHHMQCGIKLARYYLTECLRLTSSSQIDEETRNASRVLDWLKKNSKQKVEQSLLLNSGPIRKAAKLNPVLQKLASSNYVRRIQDVPAIWEVNPAAFS